MVWGVVGGAKTFWKLAGFRPCLKSRHNYSISMLSCASVFLYSSNLSQPTRHMRPSEKEPVRAPLCPQPSTSLPSPSHWLSSVDGSQGKAWGIMRAASPLVALVVIDKTLAMRIHSHWRVKSAPQRKVSFSGSRIITFYIRNTMGHQQLSKGCGTTKSQSHKLWAVCFSGYDRCFWVGLLMII